MARTSSRLKPRWKRAGSIARNERGADPSTWLLFDATGYALAQINEIDLSFLVTFPNGDTVGPYGDLALAKQAAQKRLRRR